MITISVEGMKISIDENVKSTEAHAIDDISKKIKNNFKFLNTNEILVRNSWYSSEKNKTIEDKLCKMFSDNKFMSKIEKDFLNKFKSDILDHPEYLKDQYSVDKNYDNLVKQDPLSLLFGKNDKNVVVIDFNGDVCGKDEVGIVVLSYCKLYSRSIAVGFCFNDKLDYTTTSTDDAEYFY